MASADPTGAYRFPEPVPNPSWNAVNGGRVRRILAELDGSVPKLVEPTPRARRACLTALIDAFEQLREFDVNPFCMGSAFLRLVDDRVDRLTRIRWNLTVGQAYDRGETSLTPMIRFLHGQRAQIRRDRASLAPGARCHFCEGRHPVRGCRYLYSERTPVAFRLRKLAEYRACTNCLKLGHDGGACPSRDRCEICNGKHNTVLHDDLTRAEGDAGP